MGRPAATNDRRKSKGYYRPSRHGVDEPRDGNPSPLMKPDDLSEDVGFEWDRLVSAIGHLVTADDAVQFRELAVWGAQLVKIDEHLAATIPTDANYSKLMYVRTAASREFQKIAQRFGLDPKGRQNLPRVVSDAPAAPKVQSRPKTLDD